MKKRSSSQKSPKPTVKTKGTQERVTIGMDLGDKTSRYCMLSSEGAGRWKTAISSSGPRRQHPFQIENTQLAPEQELQNRVQVESRASGRWKL
jgi:hypothetical protein